MRATASSRPRYPPRRIRPWRTPRARQSTQGRRKGAAAETAAGHERIRIATDLHDAIGHVLGPRIEAAVEAWPDAPAIATVVARIAEEALVNALKHAGARWVRVALRAPGAGNAHLEICDDGCGFDPSEQSSLHGLQIMRERAHGAGIDLALESAPGDGTRVVLQWNPVPAA